MGWNMEVSFASPDGTGRPGEAPDGSAGRGKWRVPYRGRGPFAVSLQELWGDCIEMEAGPGVIGEPCRDPVPLFVRFQGARVAARGVDVETAGSGAPLDPGSLTRWVSHPAELTPDPALGRDWPEPNVLRFAVFFDTRRTSWDGLELLGVDTLWIRAQPD